VFSISSELPFEQIDPAPNLIQGSRGKVGGTARAFPVLGSRLVALPLGLRADQIFKTVSGLLVVVLGDQFVQRWCVLQ
jgi:hypothetical protein